MTSAIDPTQPITGAATTSSVRANFQTAHDEITALQSAVAAINVPAQSSDTYASGIAAAGSTQGTATALTQDVNVVNTVASGTGVVLRAGGLRRQRVINRGANALNVFPNAGAQIEALGVNTPAIVAVGATADFYPDSSSQWWAT